VAWHQRRLGGKATTPKRIFHRIIRCLIPRLRSVFQTNSKRVNGQQYRRDIIPNVHIVKRTAAPHRSSLVLASGTGGGCDKKSLRSSFLLLIYLLVNSTGICKTGSQVSSILSKPNHRIRRSMTPSEPWRWDTM
jgi:hypothetical protein